MIRIVIAVLLLSTSAFAARVETVRNGSGGGGGGETNQSCELTGGPDCIMAGPVRAANGTAALPSLTFSSDFDNGFYYIGANSFGLSTGGTLRLTFDASAVTYALQSIYSGVSVDITSAATEDLVLQAGTTGATAVSTTVKRMFTVARNSGGTQSALVVSDDTSIADSELCRSIGSGGSGTAHFSCGAASPLVQVRATGNGYAGIHIGSPGTNATQASLWFEVSGATDDKELWAFEQQLDRFTFSNFDEDSWVSGGNFVSLALLDSGPIRPYNHTAATTVTAPATCVAGISGAMAYFDDSDDGAPAEMCFCTKVDNTATYAWRKVAAPTTSCFGL